MEHQYLASNVKMLKLLFLWQNEAECVKNKWTDVRSYYAVLVLFPSFIPIIYDLIKLTGEDSLVIMISVVMELLVILFVHYVALCFVHNREKMEKLVNAINDFHKYSNEDLLYNVDKRINFYLALYLIFAGSGLLIYVSVPFLTTSYCENYKTVDMIEYGIPCGLIIRFRLPFRFDFTPLHQLIVCYQILIVLVVSSVFVTVTMLLFGVLYHTTEQLKFLGKMISKISYKEDEENVKKYLRKIIEFHQAIISYSEEINRAFGSQMLVHVTITAVIISTIGFVVFYTENAMDSMRYAIHVGAFSGLFFVICVYGQKLIDESTAVGDALYATPWYVASLQVRKDIRLIILRTQKPLMLDASGLQVISVATFLKILSSAYSYFTLFINVKN